MAEKSYQALNLNLLHNLKRKIEELKESEERLKILFEEAPVGYYLIDLKGIILDINKAGLEIGGYEREELIGKSVLKTIKYPKEGDEKATKMLSMAKLVKKFPKGLGIKSLKELNEVFPKEAKMFSLKDLPKIMFELLLKKTCSQKIMRPVEIPTYRKDGKEIVVEMSMALIKIRGKFFILGIMRDITERKKAEEKYKSIVENVNDALIIHDLKGKIIDVNNKVCELFGYKKDKIIGEHITKFTSKKSIKRSVSHLKQLLKKGSLVFDSEAQNSEGKIIPINISAKVVSKENEKVVQSFIRDITEQKKAEEKFRTIFEGANDAIAYVNKYGEMIDINKEAEKMFGYKRDEVIGKNFVKLGILKLRDLSRVIRIFKNVAMGRKPLKIMELEAVNKKGYGIHLEVSTKVIRKNGKPESVVAILRDITERRMTEEELKRQKEKSEKEVKELKSKINKLEKKLKKKGG